MSNREQHRQGVAYGPVRPSGGRDRGAILGNLLGLIVIVVTVGVLVAGIYIFLQSRNAVPGPTATAAGAVNSAAPTFLETPAATPSVGPTATASVIPPSDLPTAGPTDAPTAPVTPAPTIFVPLVQVGPGYITFGTSFDSGLHVTDPRSTFAIDERMVWSAYLTEPANSADLKIRILKLDPEQPTGQRLIRDDDVKPAVQGIQRFVRHVRPIGASEGPGLYTIEYVRGDEVLSAGSFLVLEG